MSTELIVLTKHKNKSDFEEWLNYHLALGFNQISIYDNESLFDLHEIINNNPRIGYCKVTDKELQEITQQGLYTMHHQNSQFDWQLYIDDDEFLWFNTNLYFNVNAFVDTFPDYVDQWGIFWSLISSDAALSNRTDTLINTFKYVKTGVLEQCMKTFVRKRVIGQFLHPHKINGPNVNCYSVLGRIDDLNGTKLHDSSKDFCKIYHFQVKTKSEYDAKLNSTCADRVGETFKEVGYPTYYETHVGYTLFDPTLIDMKKRLGI